MMFGTGPLGQSRLGSMTVHTRCLNFFSCHPLPKISYAFMFIKGSALLYDFLEQNNIPSTHFMIGTNIVNNYDLFQRAFKELKGGPI